MATIGGAFRRLRLAQRHLRANFQYLPYRREPVSGERFFCQNSGSCGSTYIVNLFRANGLGPSYHEKVPDLDVFGIMYYEGTIPDWWAKAILLQTRRDTYFEANNRLFAMSSVMKRAFPDARFIHLHRDPRDLLPSSLSKPSALTWESGRRRYRSQALIGAADGSMLVKACTYWARYNDRIADDLSQFEHLSLKSSDLFAGNIAELEAYVGRRLSTRVLRPANANKPLRAEGRYPSFGEWPKEHQETLLRICGPTMERLGYLPGPAR